MILPRIYPGYAPFNRENMRIYEKLIDDMTRQKSLKNLAKQRHLMRGYEGI